MSEKDIQTIVKLDPETSRALNIACGEEQARTGKRCTRQWMIVALIREGLINYQLRLTNRKK